MGRFKLELQSGNPKFGSKSAILCPVWPWNLTDDLAKNRAPLLCCFQLCAWFHCHMWIQTGVRIRKRLSWVFTYVTLTFDTWPWPFARTSLTSIHGNNSWKFHDDTMMETWWKRCDGRIDGRTDGLNQSYSCLVAAKILFTQRTIETTSTMCVEKS